MSGESKLNHDESGNVRGTHLASEEHGIINNAAGESERQTQVVEESQKKE